MRAKSITFQQSISEIWGCPSSDLDIQHSATISHQGLVAEIGGVDVRQDRCYIDMQLNRYVINKSKLGLLYHS